MSATRRSCDPCAAGICSASFPCHVPEALAEGALREVLLLRLGLAQRDEVDGGGGGG